MRPCHNAPVSRKICFGNPRHSMTLSMLQLSATPQTALHTIDWLSINETTLWHSPELRLCPGSCCPSPRPHSPSPHLISQHPPTPNPPSPSPLPLLPMPTVFARVCLTFAIETLLRANIRQRQPPPPIDLSLTSPTLFWAAARGMALAQSLSPRRNPQQHSPSCICRSSRRWT